MAAIYLYPSLCFFEGTAISLGRGTNTPFQLFGHPSFKSVYPNYSFTPRAMSGASNPPLKDQLCYGVFLTNDANEAWNLIDGKLQIKWLLDAYKNFPDKEVFFNKDKFINLLAGDAAFRQQIMDGKSEAEIRATWKPALTTFKSIRAKYLLYP